MIHIDIEHKMLTSEGKGILKMKVDIPENNLICISGQSGIGKTTLLRISAGVTRPDRGLIKIGDTLMYDSSQKVNLSLQKRLHSI